MCKICHRDSEKHSEKLWLLHKQQIKCSFCGENSSKHSVELWDIHQKAVPKNAKLVTMQQGFGPSTLAKIVEWKTVKVNGRDDPYHLEFVPISIPCVMCGSAMSSSETDLAKVSSIDDPSFNISRFFSKTSEKINNSKTLVRSVNFKTA